ncbi:hypothetical protein CQW23_15472 [Capsicum baccatum]|uniref:Uncharacterized protein n=1 Tax=Capsicum baccatum TaxID=33114 RepID=A0A2G2WM44_CAPBA|nr:hypothetical protein CQW23_15472 [Capsicum baccatum]
MPRNNWSSPLTTECPGSYCGGVRPEVPVPAGMNAGDEVVLSQAENNAYIVQLLLESPSDVVTSARKGKLLNIENQIEDALAIAHAFDLSVFSNPCRDLFSLKPTSQLDGLELDSAANIGSNNAADFELSIGTGNAKSFAEPFLLAYLL